MENEPSAPPSNEPPAVVNGISDVSARYQASIDYLRARGCRCMLVWNGSVAVPYTAAEAIDCPVNHAD